MKKKKMTFEKIVLYLEEKCNFHGKNNKNKNGRFNYLNIKSTVSHRFTLD